MFEQQAAKQRETAGNIFMGVVCLGGLLTIGLGTALTVTYFDDLKAKQFIAGTFMGVLGAGTIGMVSGLLMKHGCFKDQETAQRTAPVNNSIQEEYEIHYTPV